jgi:hypothetical protein
MTALGRKILETWVSVNVPLAHVADDVLIRSLTAKLKADASAAGLTMQDLELDKVIVESFIKEAILFQPEPGTPGD